MHKLFKAILATVALAAPLYANAIPVTWNYAGVCTAGDCDVLPSITGTLTGDPTLDPFGDDDHLTDLFLIGEVTSYSFWIGGHHFSGNDALGQYRLNAAGNIVDGSMTFGSLGLLLTIGDVSDAVWSFVDKKCFLIFCSIEAEASGTGAYTRATAVPEPTTLGLLGLGLLGLGLAHRRRRPG